MKKWVSIWGNAMSIAENKPESYAKGITLRYFILNTIKAEAIRLSFDNFTGKEPVTLNQVTLAKTTDQKTAEGEIKRVFFNGKEEAFLKAGERIVSDPVEMEAEAGEGLLVSIYLDDYTLMRSAVATSGPLSKGFYATGNQCMADDLPHAAAKEIGWCYFLSQVDVLCQSGQAVVCYGDSITSQAWPEYFQMNLLAQKEEVGIVRRAVSGSRVLRQYDCLMYESYGLKGSVRFPHELEACGVSTVIILQGVNDFIHPVGEEENEFRPWSDLPSAEELIEGLRNYIRIAKDKNIRVILGTILPIKGWRTYASFRNELRKEVNAWIRNTDEADAVIDFDEIMRDPSDPDQLNPSYDSGDHLHPNLAGHKEMAKAAESVLKSQKF